MRVDRDEPGDASKMSAGFAFSISFLMRSIAPRGGPEAVVLDVEDDALDRPVESSSQMLFGLCTPVPVASWCAKVTV